MPSTYSTSLRFELIGTGEQSGTWGSTTNTNLGTLIEESIAGYESINHPNTSYTLSALNGSSDESRNMIINFTGTLTANRNVNCPSSSKLYCLRNATTGGFDIIFGVSGGGTTVNIPAGTEAIVWCDGTNCREAVTTASTFNAQTIDFDSGTISGTVTESATVTQSGTRTVTGTLDVSGGTITFAAGQVESADINSLSASKLLSGTVPTDRLTGTYNIDISGDADTLDTLQATQFLRSDAADVKDSGDLTFNDGISLKMGTDADSAFYHSGANQYLDLTTGDFYIRNSTTTKFTFERSTGNFTAEGDITAFSDARLKDNVSTIDGSLDKVCAMRGVTFVRRDNETKGAGVIAQELADIAPELIHENADGLYSVAYGNMAGYFIEAFKELKAENDDLKERIEALEAK